MKVYIAGPMTNMPNFNFVTFDRAKIALESFGYEVVCPTDIDRQHGWVTEVNGQVLTTELFDIDTAVKVCCNFVAGCDAIALLPGWHKSYGAKKELAVALENDLSVLLLTADLSLII